MIREKPEAGNIYARYLINFKCLNFLKKANPTWMYSGAGWDLNLNNEFCRRYELALWKISKQSLNHNTKCKFSEKKETQVP